MNDPYVIAALITLMGVMGAAAITMLRHNGKTNNMKEVLNESRTAHSKIQEAMTEQMKALAIVLERVRGEKQ